MTSRQMEFLDNFTDEEVTDTGARLRDVKFETLWKLQLVRNQFNFAFLIISLTTGKHRAKEHPDGKAVDWVPRRKISFKTAQKIIYWAITMGFRGIGLYHNGNVYQFHFDTRSEYSFWAAKMCVQTIRGKRVRKWKYYPLIIDPQTMK